MSSKKSTKKGSGAKYQISDEVIIIENFEHMPGKNCQLSSLRKVLAFHDIELSENMLLGIASGLGFIYWMMKQMPTPFIGGLNGKDITLFENVLSRLGGKAELLKTGSQKISYKQFKDQLREGSPLITFVDMAYLPYFFRDDAPYPNEEIGHFGGHTFVIYGLDEKENIIYVSDRYKKPNTLTIEQFMDAHSSNFTPFPAKNRKLKIIAPEKNPQLDSIIIEAIKENGEFMRNPPIKNFGLEGMLKFKKMVKKWPEDYNPEQLLWVLTNTWIYNQTGGTGGALFRNMYTEFLSEAYEIVQLGALKEATDIYRQAAAIWDNVALCLLPDELPAMREIRWAFSESNKVQEEALPHYQKKLREIDDHWKEYKAAAIEEAANYQKYVPALQDAIQKAYDLEVKAWETLMKV
ncbi:MAG: BtrH N-terminal domain-containing protein [Candidatus Hermodarchaeota archaeon]